MLEKYLQQKFLSELRIYADDAYIYSECDFEEWKEHDKSKNRIEKRRVIKLLAEMLRDNNIAPFNVEGLRNKRETWKFEFEDVLKQEMEWVWSMMINHHMSDYVWGEPGSHNFDMNVGRLVEILEKQI